MEKREMREAEIRSLLDFAMDAAWQAGQLTLSYFRTGAAVELKPDGSPVTAADREAEALLRRLIAARYPDHSVVGEEHGADDKRSDFRWWLDPIDGTRAFVRGVPLYGVLVALEVDTSLVIGVAHFPALGEMVAAGRQLGCRWNGRLVRVSTVDSVHQAAMLSSDAFELARRQPRVFERLVATGSIQRGWGDCYGHCLVAAGRAEVMLDPIMSPWDCAALVPIVTEAGGAFTDWSGAARIDGGSAVSTNGLLHPEVLRLLECREGPGRP